ncbi:M56 family metallopeptidase [Lentisphaera profundi]|uniref:M56 family metallopeptidase n=1 Tax=Lentisphaera profundi TaxID=1658616 RepID=A0ABY7VS36_9BACT|nr:M56 family metallopeptidase [Lentisphaera profundi]WDE95666.1 M56 family metallopeptidase [Lentisphaera profundi]
MNYLSEALIQGSLLLLGLTFTLVILRPYLSPGSKLLLHKLVFLRFLLPGLFLASLSLSHFSKDVPILTQSVSPLSIKSEPSIKPEQVNPINNLTIVSISKKSQWPLFKIWLSGVLLCLGLSAYFSLKQHKKLNSRVPLLQESTTTLLNDCRKRVGVNRFLGLSECTHLASPALYGLLEPEIILPLGLVNELSNEELEHVFLHELTHLKNADNWWDYFFLTIQILNWYNPLVWWFRARTQELQEQACDAQAISYLNEPKAYASTLIKVLEFPNLPMWPRSQGITYLSQNKKQLKRRITMIGKKYNNFSYIAAVVLLLGLLSTGFATSESIATETAQNAKHLVKDIDQKQIVIKSQIIEGVDILTAPAVITKEDQTATIRIVQERYLPKSWQKPKAIEKGKGLEVVSSKPVFGEPTELGISLEVTPSLVRLPKFAGQVHLSGKVLITKMADSKISQHELKVDGQSIGNHILAIESSEASFSLVTENGKNSEINITFNGKPIIIKIEAEVLDSNGLSLFKKP